MHSSLASRISLLAVCSRKIYEKYIIYRTLHTYRCVEINVTHYTPLSTCLPRSLSSFSSSLSAEHKDEPCSSSGGSPRGWSSSTLSGICAMTRQVHTPKTSRCRLTGKRRRYASKDAHAASVNTALKLTAYESRATRWMSGGRLPTRRAEWRIFLIICAGNR